MFKKGFVFFVSSVLLALFSAFVFSGCDIFEALARQATTTTLNSGDTPTTLEDSTTTTISSGETSTTIVSHTTTTKPSGSVVTNPSGGATTTTLKSSETTTTVIVTTTTTTTVAPLFQVPTDWDGTYVYDRVTFRISNGEIFIAFTGEPEVKLNLKFYLSSDYSYCIATANIYYTYEGKDYHNDATIKLSRTSDGNVEYSVSVNGGQTYFTSVICLKR